MNQSQPRIIRTIHTLPFDKLSPVKFEELCLWLVQREGFGRAEHLGAAGCEQGRDIVAWRGDQLWAFQCKCVQHFYPKNAEAEVDKVLGLADDLRPAALVFLVACDVSDKTRNRARARCAGKMQCDFWAGAELDEKVWNHPDIVSHFFGLVHSVEALRRLFPELEPAFQQLDEALSQLITHYQVLTEWKDLHHLLQTCLLNLSPFVTEVDQAYLGGQPWDPKRGRTWWRPCKVSIGELELFAARVKHIGSRRFCEDEHHLRGDPWIVDIVNAGRQVELLLDTQEVAALDMSVYDLLSKCEIHLRYSDTNLRRAAANISQVLHGTLRSIGQ